MKKYFCALLFLSLSNAHAAPACNVPPITGKTYHQSRALLIEKGYMPALLPDREGAHLAHWIRYGYTEVMDCAPTGTAPCLFEWKDGNGRAVTVTTEGEKARRVTCGT